MQPSSSMFGHLADVLENVQNDWSVTARPNQLPPPGDWRIWLLLAGRGFGKTRTICEWVRMLVESGAVGRIALVAATAADARDVLIEGPAGLLAIAPSWNRPIYEPTKRRVTWPNGAIATTYSADEPERLRGPQHDAAVCDELAAWRYPEAWDMLMFGLRLGKNPRCVAATTPKPLKILRDLIAREGKDVVITRGSTLENRDNLAATFIEQVQARYGGTRLGRQELNGEMLDDVPGALWTRETIEASRVASSPQHQQRVVIGIDPAGSTTEGADVTGIIAAAIGADGEAYVIADLSGRYAPTDWARRSIACYHSLKADKIVIERNFGGDMAKATLASIDAGVPVKEVNSSRGKVLRAEPIASLFEQRRAHLVGTFPELEDQMAAFTSDWDRARDGSPDRVDAMVFALTELMLGQPQGGFFRERSLLTNGEPVDDMPIPRGCFAVIGCPGKATPQDAVSVVYFALHLEARPLYLIDWELHEIDGDSLDNLLTAISARLDTLRAGCRCTNPLGGIWIEESAIDSALLGQGVERGHDVHNLDERLMLPSDLIGRANAAARFISTGKHIKITRPAHDKQATFRGVTRNHFMAQFLGFSGIETPNEPSELFNALCVAAIITFGGVNSTEDK
jgi:predicted phage terminase large subunit-like protein